MNNKITPEIIRQAYSATHCFQNGNDLDETLKKGHTNSENGYWLDRYSAIYYIIENLKDTPFEVWCLASDGGIRDYLILYKWGNYSIVISQESYMDENNSSKIESIHQLCDWLNEHIEAIEKRTKHNE